MKTKELQAVLQQLKDTVANAQCLIASIEAMLESSNENPKEETPEDTPVVSEVSNVPIIKEEVEELHSTAELEYNEEFPSSAEITEYNEELDMARDAYYFEHKEDPRKEVEGTTLLEPPTEVHIDIPKDSTPDEETIIACQILSKLPDFYNGTCRSIVLQKQWHDNSNKINPKTGKNYDKLHINKYKVVVTAEDIEGYPLGSIIIHWDTLAKWHDFLISKGINKHKETDNPHTNWMPEEVSLCID